MTSSTLGECSTAGLPGAFPTIILWKKECKLPKPMSIIYRYETVVSKELLGQGYFRVLTYNRANHIALNLPYATRLFSFFLIWVAKGTTY